jgi:hypothetical protein
MRKMMIAVAAALSLGGRFGGGHFGRGFRGGFRGLYGFGGILPYYGYGYGNSCCALTPTATLGSAPETGWCPYWAPL